MKHNMKNITNKIDPLIHIEQDLVKVKAAQPMVKETKQGQRLTAKAALPARQSAKSGMTGRGPGTTKVDPKGNNIKI